MAVVRTKMASYPPEPGQIAYITLLMLVSSYKNGLNSGGSTEMLVIEL